MTRPNLRLQKFTAELLKHNDATKAAIAAGYSKKNPAVQGQRLRNHPEVKAAIAKALAKSEAAAAWNAERAIKELEEIKNLALSGEFINCGAAIKAIEGICKIKGLFAPEKKELEFNGGVKSKITFEQLCNSYANTPKRKIQDTTTPRKSKA